MNEGRLGVWIPEEYRIKDLNWIDRVCLVEIDFLSRLEGGCIASNAHFAEYLEVSKDSASRIIQKLVKLGLVDTENVYKNNRVDYRIITLTNKLRELKGGYRKNTVGTVKMPRGYRKNAEGNNTVNNNSIYKENKTKDLVDEYNLDRLSLDESPPVAAHPPTERPITYKDFMSYFPGSKDNRAVAKEFNDIWLNHPEELELIKNHLPEYISSTPSQYIKKPLNYLRHGEYNNALRSSGVPEENGGTQTEAATAAKIKRGSAGCRAKVSGSIRKGRTGRVQVNPTNEQDWGFPLSS